MLRKDFLWGGAVTAHQSEGGYTEGGGKFLQYVT